MTTFIFHLLGHAALFIFVFTLKRLCREVRSELRMYDYLSNDDKLVLYSNFKGIYYFTLLHTRIRMPLRETAPPVLACPLLDGFAQPGRHVVLLPSKSTFDHTLSNTSY